MTYDATSFWQSVVEIKKIIHTADEDLGLLTWKASASADDVSEVCGTLFAAAYALRETLENNGTGLWHYWRICDHCGEKWGGIHCPHDGVQNVCPACGKYPDINHGECGCEFDC